MRLRGPQFEQLRDALLDAFSPEEFDAMLLCQLDRRRSDYSLGPDQRTIVLRTIEAAHRRGWVSELLKAARLSNPRNPQLLRFAQQFGRAATMPQSMLDATGLERTIRQANSMLDVVQWRAQLAEIENQVCRIEILSSPPVSGTGFLLGPRSVITSYHVMERVITHQIAPSMVSLRFDYALMSDGITPNPGTSYKLSEEDWLVDHSEYNPSDLAICEGGAEPQPSQLDYALLRVADEPGHQLVGGQDNKDPNAPRRGWIEVPLEPHDFQPGTPVFILQHPEGEPLKLALDTDSVIGVNANSTRVRYRTSTDAGSSGSPCFDASWQLIALHQGGDPNFESLHMPLYNQGIPFMSIVSLLEKRGLLHLLRGLI